MIEIRNLCKNFGEKCVLKDVSLTVPDGAVFGLVGINGAGKSTLLRLMAGILAADNGEILFDGKKAFENPQCKKDIFFLPDDPYYTSNITGEKLREIYRTFYPFDDKLFSEMTEEFKLDTNGSLRSFSKGMRRQIFAALALATRPKYLLLDEAFDGLDPLARLAFKRRLIALCKDGGSTVMISSHSLRELEDISDCYGLLDECRVASSGELDIELGKVFKFQIAFHREVSREEFGFPCLAFRSAGRVVQVVVRGDKEKILASIEALSPVLVDELPMDFEEFFLSEVDHKGYLQ